MKDQPDIELPLLSDDSQDGESLAQSPPLPSHFIDFLRPNPDPIRFRPIENWRSYVFFYDALPLARLINKSPNNIDKKSLPLPYTDYNIERKVFLLDQAWQAQSNKETRSIIKAIAVAFKKEFIISFILLMLTCTGHLVTNMMLGYIIDKITEHNIKESIVFEEILPIVLNFSVLYFLTQFCETWVGHFDFIIGAEIRLTLTGFIYKKINSISANSLQEISSGKIINIISNDLNDVDFGYGYVFPTLISPYNILLACYVMWGFFQSYTFISIICLTFFLLFAIKMSNQSEAPRIEKNALTDERVRSTNEIIECIRLIKQYAWEIPFMKAVQTFRLGEVAALLKIGKIEANGRTITESSVYLCTLLTCVIYVAFGGVLTPGKVYTSMMVLNFLKFWAILFFHFGRMFFINLRVITQRIHEILNTNDVLTIEETLKKSSKKDSILKSSTESDPNFIEFKNYTAYATPTTQKPQLQNLNLKIPTRFLTTVIGKIGSGKSSLLLAFLKEMGKTTGELKYKGSVAYVEQEPVIFPGTIRENILFGKSFKPEYYKSVIRACGWERDFAQMPSKDETIVGERGVTLSGGQKARISLARALYADCDIYLLDDPLSAVDSRVAKHLFNLAIKEILKEKTVILVTHHLSYAAESDRVVVMKDGGVEAEGTFKELQNQKIDLMELFKAQEKKNDDLQAQSEANVELERRKSTMNSSAGDDRKMSLRSREGDYPPEEEEREEKAEDSVRVTWETYKGYLKASENYTLLWITLAVYLASQLFIFGFTRFIGHWATLQNEAAEENELDEFLNGPYIVISILLMLGIMLTYYLKILFTIKFLTETNSKLHQRILSRLLHAVVSFFDLTPSGQILNRFSGDIGTLDKQNWIVIFDLLDGFMYSAFFLGYLCYVNYTIIPPALLIIYFLYRVKQYFTKPTIELKRVDLVSRSPLSSEINSTMNGLLTIRVYKQGGRFLKNFINLIYDNARAFYYNARATRTFMVTLKLFLYILTVSGILLFVFLGYYGGLDSGIFGLALLYLLEIANKSVWTIRQTLFLDLNMQSAQRVLEYCNLPQEPSLHKEPKDTQVKAQSQGKWPNKGEIEFKKVTLRYNNKDNPALRGVSFQIPAGTKVGIVGRTGAGKSSIIQALFRMVEIDAESESFIKIDGVDIRDVGLEFLRKNLAIIPQTPAVFRGTIKKNLDPFEIYSNEEIWKVLESIDMKKIVEGFEKKLETDMSNVSSLFSAGQKQLICLARSMLRKSKVVILDEATANVDIETDKLIQNRLEENFRDATVLTIAHRLRNIAGYDRILTINNGTVVEYENPYKLLVNQIGDKEITNVEGHFAKMVLNSGEKIAREIFDIAYQKFYNIKR